MASKSHLSLPISAQISHFPSRESAVHRPRTGAGSAPVAPSDINPSLIHNPVGENLESLEVNIEKVLRHSRRLGIVAFQEYFVDQGKVIALLVEATDVYLLGTVMLVFGMDLYELFISNLNKAKTMADGGKTKMAGSEYSE